MALMPTIVPQNKEASSAAHELVKAYENYKITRERELTNRERIRADRDVALCRLNHQRDILEIYFKNIFAERSVVIEKMFETLDAGIERDNNFMIAEAMDGIVKLIQTSPLSDFNKYMSQYDDPNVDVIDI